MAKFCFFHLMSYLEIEDSSQCWPIPNEPFERGEAFVINWKDEPPRE